MRWALVVALLVSGGLASLEDPGLPAVLHFEEVGPTAVVAGGRAVGVRVEVTYCHHPAGAAATQPTVVALAVDTMRGGVAATVTPYSLEFRPTYRPDSVGNCLEPQYVAVEAPREGGQFGEVMLLGEARANPPLANASEAIAVRVASPPMEGESRGDARVDTSAQDDTVTPRGSLATAAGLTSLAAVLAAVAVTWRVRRRR